MSGVPVPRLRGIAYALEVIEGAEKTARNLAATVESALGLESPIGKELRSLSWRLGQSAELVKEDIASAGEAGTAGTTQIGPAEGEHATREAGDAQ